MFSGRGRTRTCKGFRLVRVATGCHRPVGSPFQAASAGFEPASLPLTAGRSTVERQGIESQRWDSNPLGPLYGSGARPVGLHWHRSGWPAGVEPAWSRFTAGSRCRWSSATVLQPGIEPGPRPSQGRAISVSPSKQLPVQESNLPTSLRRAGARSARQAVDRGGNRTLICRVQTGRLPVGRHAQVPSVAPVGFEPTSFRLRGGRPAIWATRP